MMNPVKREEDESVVATEKDQTTRPEVAEDTVLRQTWPGTPAAPSPRDLSEGSGAIRLKPEVSVQEAPLIIQAPDGKCHFTFTLNESSGKSDCSVLSAYGKPSENIYSALRANDTFCERMKNHFNKDILVYEEKEIKRYINLGMPLKCLPEGSHLKVSVSHREKDKEENHQLFRECENPDLECILFQVLAIGKTIKKIVKVRAFHEKGSTLCIYAMKGETVREALCKDGRFRSDLDELKWKLIEKHKNVHGKQSMVEEVSGKVLEMDIKPSVGKGPPRKTEQQNENATAKICVRDRMASQAQVHEPELERGTEDTEPKPRKVLPPRGLVHDIKGKRLRTISRIIRHYSKIRGRKYRKQNWHSQQRPRLAMQRALDQDVGKEATGLWLKNWRTLGSVIVQQCTNFSKDARWMRNYFREERKRTKLTPLKQFYLYEKCFAKVTRDSVSVATYELRTHLSKSVGYMECNYNGNTVVGTCFVFNHGYIFTCRHVIHEMVGEGTDPALWPAIISQCAKVTFSYTGFRPPVEEWFSIEPWFEVSDQTLDYAILKLTENGNGFPQGLFQHISPLPPTGLLFIIGHPEGRVKEVDVCAVITLKERWERYAKCASELEGLHADAHAVCSMFTPRSFPEVATRTDALSYDTCFTGGSSGSPVFDAKGSVVGLHAFGQYYWHGGKAYGLIEFAYSMKSILCDVREKNEALHELLVKEKCEHPNQEKSNKQELSLQKLPVEPMEH